MTETSERISQSSEFKDSKLSLKEVNAMNQQEFLKNLRRNDLSPSLFYQKWKENPVFCLKLLNNHFSDTDYTVLIFRLGNYFQLLREQENEEYKNVFELYQYLTEEQKKKRIAKSKKQQQNSSSNVENNIQKKLSAFQERLKKIDQRTQYLYKQNQSFSTWLIGLINLLLGVIGATISIYYGELKIVVWYIAGPILFSIIALSIGFKCCSREQKQKDSRFQSTQKRCSWLHQWLRSKDKKPPVQTTHQSEQQVPEEKQNEQNSAQNLMKPQLNNAIERSENVQK